MIAREIAYHGTTLGALAATGHHRDARRRSSRSCRAARTCPNTNSYRWPAERDPLWAAEAIAERIVFEGPETVAAVILEPVQNGGGCIRRQEGYFQRVREICDAPRRAADLRRGDLLVGAARLHVRLRALRLPAGHHHDRQGDDLGLRADGRDDRLRPRRRAVPARHGIFAHGFTFGGHPIAAAVALANIDLIERERHLRARARARSGEFRAMLEGLRDIPIVGDVRGAGYFHAIELVKDKRHQGDLRRRGVRAAAARLPLRRPLPRGLICRTDDRGDPVIQLAPPLIGDREQFAEIEARAAHRADRGAGADRAG